MGNSNGLGKWRITSSNKAWLTPWAGTTHSSKLSILDVCDGADYASNGDAAYLTTPEKVLRFKYSEGIHKKALPKHMRHFWDIYWGDASNEAEQNNVQSKW